MRALVFGSAADYVAPTGQFDMVLAANGGAGLARRAGYRLDALVTTAWCAHDNEPHREIWEQWRDLYVPVAWVDETDGLAGDLCRRFEAVHAVVDKLVPMSSAFKWALIRKWTGTDYGHSDEHPDKRVSTGVTAVVLALEWGATIVTLAGFSTRPGHAYTTRIDPLYHQKPDAAVLAHLRKFGCLTA